MMGFSVYGYFFYSFCLMLRIQYLYVINGTPELTSDPEAIPFIRYAGINYQAVIIGSDSQNILADSTIFSGSDNSPEVTIWQIA